MRTTDLLTLPLAALGRQKTRTALTTLGVVFGAFVLAASLSIGDGVQRTIARESRRAEVSRRVDVFASWKPAPAKAETPEIQVEGAMGEARRERLRKALAVMAQQATAGQARPNLNQARLREITALPHVARSIPMAYNAGFALLGEKSEGVQIRSVRPVDAGLRARMVAGRDFDAPDQHAVILSEFLAYRLGFRDEADLAGLVGKSIRLEFRGQAAGSGFRIYVMTPEQSVTREERAALDKVQARLPGALEKLDLTKPEADALRAALKPAPVAETETYDEDFPVLGVIRDRTEEEAKQTNRNWDPTQAEGDVLIPYQAGTDLFFRGPGHAEQGVDQLVLMVDEEANVKSVAGAVEAMGLQARAPIEFIERERVIYLLIFKARASPRSPPGCRRGHGWRFRGRATRPRRPSRCRPAGGRPRSSGSPRHRRRPPAHRPRRPP